MQNKIKHTILKGVAAFAVTLFFACGNNAEELQRFSQRTDGPAAKGEGIVLRYTDSGKVKATLKTPYMLDYGISEFPYQEFPDGIDVTFVSDDDKENYITSNYAKLFKQTNLVDLRNNVVLIMSDSTILRTSQLYWDQRNNWVFTNRAYTINFQDGSFNNGNGFDSSENFKNFLSSGNQSKMYIKEGKNTKSDSLNE
ncbi:LPS export ABC transporter periplasmic protein LptC [Flavimarina sp. Hel_I_48]|uniref:LPS export ABC transporter periplasmic protein LptC n=1 Tax=Flavimarina sp. Hel_I_48 TaxID=1392488 RepID=UPI000689AED3|nr:LPS export ABC transporter periplasmic protein LptC [Flavimarina sp. Hel_I_48]